jgi:hypothetical protein
MRISVVILITIVADAIESARYRLNANEGTGYIFLGFDFQGISLLLCQTLSLTSWL